MTTLNKVSLISGLYNKGGFTPFNGIIEEREDYVVSTSHKLMLEGIDFNLIYNPLKHLGYKCILAVIGPHYANGAKPFSVSATLGLSSRFGKEQIETLWEGMTAAFKEHSIDNVHIDLVPSLTGITISLSSQAKQKRELFVQRPICKEGDLLCVNGSLGSAYMGLQILEREKQIFQEVGIQPQLEEYKFVLSSYLSPMIDTALFNLFKKTKIIPSYGEFITEGLAHSVKKMCASNNVGAKIFMNRIPIASAASQVANELNVDPVVAALNGGDDYKFLIAVPLEKHSQLVKEFPQLDIIGHLSSIESGTLLITPDGQELELKAQAWNN